MDDLGLSGLSQQGCDRFAGGWRLNSHTNLRSPQGPLKMFSMVCAFILGRKGPLKGNGPAHFSLEIPWRL